VRRRMETRSALHAGRNAVPRTPLRGERWRRRGQHARLVGSADCDAYYESGRFFSRNGGLLRPQETCRRVFLVWERRDCRITCGLRRVPFSLRVRLKTHTNGKKHDAGKITQERGSLSALRKGPEFDLFSSVGGPRDGRRSTEASVRVRPSDVRLRSLRRRSRISAPRRDDSASRLGAVAPRSSRGAPRC
jgi:hypothetical protein